MCSLKIIEWNINNRAGHPFTKKSEHLVEHPDWLTDEITIQNPDIFILTELYRHTDSWKWIEHELENIFYLHYSNNNQYMQNDICIGLKKETFEIDEIIFIPSVPGKFPDDLFIKCRKKNKDNELLICGIRIHTIEKQQRVTEWNNYLEQIKQLNDESKNNPSIIIAGDFNNYRYRYGIDEQKANLLQNNKIEENDNEDENDKNKKIWNEDYINKTCSKNELTKHTPDIKYGSSWGSYSNDISKIDPEKIFRQDHFITKNISVDEDKIRYDTCFMSRHYNKNVDENKVKERITNINANGQEKKWWAAISSSDTKWKSKIEPPYPNHAILVGNFKL